MDWLIDLRNTIIKKGNIIKKGLKILTPKQMLQRVPIVLAQVTAANTSENLLNEIRQIKKDKVLRNYITI